MHDLIIATLFMSLLMSPCLLALRASRDLE